MTGRRRWLRGGLGTLSLMVLAAVPAVATPVPPLASVRSSQTVRAG